MNDGRAERREELRIELERLIGRVARSNDAGTKARLLRQIERIQGRISRA
jgi:hypothetical protein